MVIDYKETLNLPVTTFSMRGNLAKREPAILKRWKDDQLYHIVCSKKNRKGMFFIHDGPPYANGNIHIGHSVNKILKDIIIKSKTLIGYNVPYIPGWDCHGLPIELKVEELMIKSNHKKVDNKNFRLMCRQYAFTQIEQQKKDFIRLGVLADWENYYCTMNFITEANIIRCLSRIIKQGYVYRDVKPVYWCIKCCSVLSESELEYNNFLSPSIYLEFSSLDSYDLAVKFGFFNFEHSISLIVWNTTPWTLPGNRALAVHPNYDYCLVEIKKKYYVFAILLLDNVLNRLDCSEYRILGSLKGKDLEFSLFKHPFMSFNVPIVLADYILSTVGTGIVHIAPGHGMDDYVIAKKYNLEVYNVVDCNGFYKSNILSFLNNLTVFESNDVIVALLKKSGKLLYFEKYKHSYPHCWRHKTPVIFRTTVQWFINLDHCDLRQRCLCEIDKMCWIPESGRESMKSMLIDRPDWCISRQRSWGVPITIFLHRESGELHPCTVELMEKIAQKVEKFGVQIWWDLSIQDITGSEDKQYNKVYDVLDVWFDSGSTYLSSIAIREEFKEYIPDMYLEGSDQYRGWFMSSLLLSVAIVGHMPCKTVLSHGFSVDSQGRKMSKSLGNVISPQEIVNKFGADILRLWVASNDYTTEMVCSIESIQYSVVAYRRIRNTIRFILGNLSDFNPNKDIVHPDEMVILDRWIISRTLSVQLEIISDYKNYNFHKIVQRIMYFCSVELGSFYLDVIKDRQYVVKRESIVRRSSQTALYHIIEAMVRWIIPIIPFTADEIWKHMPGNRLSYVFVEEWYQGLCKMDALSMMNEDYWNIFLQVRTEVNKVIEQERKTGYIRSSLEADIVLYVNSELAKLLFQLGDELRFGFLTSSARVKDYDFSSKNKIYKKSIVEGLKIFLKKAKGRKCFRCWHYTLDVGLDIDNPNICFRCITNMFGVGEKRKFI